MSESFLLVVHERAADAASNCAGLIAAGVTHVLNCSSLSNPLDGVAGAPPHYMQLGLLDNTSDLPRMQEALGTGVEYISSAIASGGTVLVHCHRGISRSATLAIAHLTRATQQPAELVFEQMRTKRRVIDPNLGYWVALKEWERRVLPPPVLRVHSHTNRCCARKTRRRWCEGGVPHGGGLRREYLHGGGG